MPDFPKLGGATVFRFVAPGWAAGEETFGNFADSAAAIGFFVGADIVIFFGGIAVFACVLVARREADTLAIGFADCGGPFLARAAVRAAAAVAVPASAEMEPFLPVRATGHLPAAADRALGAPGGVAPSSSVVLALDRGFFSVAGITDSRELVGAATVLRAAFFFNGPPGSAVEIVDFERSRFDGTGWSLAATREDFAESSLRGAGWTATPG